jgi:MOSC domain-containing protein YiiM
MQGVIVQVAISNGGLPKLPVSGGLVSFPGIEGDRHARAEIHGGPRKAVLLVSAEFVEELKALGENLTTRGIDFRRLPVGRRLRAGGALMEITQARGPCSALDVYGASLKYEICDARVKAGDSDSPLWGMSGLYASVIEPGAVRPGDIIVAVDEPA